jgi:hypothetical protein
MFFVIYIYFLMTKVGNLYQINPYPIPDLKPVANLIHVKLFTNPARLCLLNGSITGTHEEMGNTMLIPVR